MIRGWLIKEIEISSGDDAFEQMKKLLGWSEDIMIELVPISSSQGKCHMIVDEEGLRKDLTPNPVASSFREGRFPIVGDVIILEDMLR